MKRELEAEAAATAASLKNTDVEASLTAKENRVFADILTESVWK